MNGPLGLRSVLFCGTIQHEQHSIHLVMYHIIWCPKRQRKVLVGSVHGRLKQIIREVADEHMDLIGLNRQRNHRPVLLRCYLTDDRL